MATIIDNGAEYGMASFNSEQFAAPQDLFSGKEPENTTNELVDPAAISGGDLPAFSVVGRDATSKQLVLANLTTPVVPIGVTTARVVQGATNKNVAIWRDGQFNPDRLNWHADYNTDAKKKLAFEAGMAGNALFIKRPDYAGVNIY